jgi:hypothetical protein
MLHGGRGLSGDSSLAQVLAEQRGKRVKSALPPLGEEQILGWAESHRDRTGRWPSAASGPVAEAPGEKWRDIDQALRCGFRGLPGGDSLSRLLDRRRR